ncbi:MAG: hypothetical protein AB4290_20600 [Spirulina sp.]
MTSIVSGFGYLGLLFFNSKPVEAVTINFSVTNNLLDINNLGLDITGSGIVDFSSGSLGIGDNGLIDDGESITFLFTDGLANLVGTFSTVLTLDTGGSTPGAGMIEAFDIDGISLGNVNISTIEPQINVSNLFGNQLISQFTFTADSLGGRNFAEISFEPVPTSTLEPSLLLALSALGLAGIKGLKRKKH